MSNYTAYHVHTQLSLLDSCTKYQEYVEKAKECGMTALAFSEHGHCYEWYHKKTAIEAAGMKYIHAAEVYVTEFADPKTRDNYHCILISRNEDGFHELNRLISHSFNRDHVKVIGDDDRYYYAPRILYSDLVNTSDNIIITTACIAGILSKGNDALQDDFLKFLDRNQERCFLEIQHHNVQSQIDYNRKLFDIHQQTGIRLIAGTDTHALNLAHVKGRSILQKSKGIVYDDEAGWDLTFKTYNELVTAYGNQAALPIDVVYEAIDNTNIMASMVESFELDINTKYPHIYDDSIGTFKKKINQAYNNHPYIKDRYSKKEVSDTVKNELDTYIKTKSIDFMLLQQYLREWEKEQGIACGYGRGSVSGSEIAYILGITQMDSKRFGLNFFRFLNPSRVTNADIDTDYSGRDRDRVKEFLLKDHMNLKQIQCAEIITFNTIALKGAIRDVCRGLYAGTSKDYLKIADYICDNVEANEEKMRQEYPEVFEYVDILNGTVVSVGSHPSGVLVTDRELPEQIGLCSLSTSNYPVSMLNMKELDALMYVKLDILGLDNIGIINDTCKLVGIDRLTPDNCDLEDEKVWKSISEDTTCIFQWESESAAAYLKKFMSDETLQIAKSINPNFSYIKWFSFGNGLIRPGCASFRDNVASGEILTTGFKELDEFLAVTLGRITMQEDIMQFLVKFCGYSDAESDTVRRGIAKKYGTEKFIDEIHDRFLTYSHKMYDVSIEMLEAIFPPIKQGILDASAYAFSWNHSDSYSCIGYICGYLRYYYPVEFLTAALNIFKDDNDKTHEIINYAKKVNVKLLPIQFRHSHANYAIDVEHHAIYKGIGSIKYMSDSIADELYALRDNAYETFVDLLYDIFDYTSANSRQIEILIRCGYFTEFGSFTKLVKQYEIVNSLHDKKQLDVQKMHQYGLSKSAVEPFAAKISEKIVKISDMKALIKYICAHTEYPEPNIKDQLAAELEYFGYITTVMPDTGEDYYYVTELSGYNNNTLTLYQLKTGQTCKIKNKCKDMDTPQAGDIIRIMEKEERNKWRKVAPTTDNPKGFEKTDERELVITKFRFVK